MSIVTSTPPDSETEVIVSVDEEACSVSAAAENVPEASPQAESTPAVEAEPAAGEEQTVTAEAEDEQSAAEVGESHPSPSPPSPAPEETSAEPWHAQRQPVVKLYEHRCPYNECPLRWSRFARNQDEQDELESEICLVPIVQRYAYDSENREWTTKSFEINCSHMRAFLSDALAGYQDLDMDLEGWSFEPPYNPLVHRWQRIPDLHQQLKLSSDDEDSDKNEAVDELMEFLEPLLAPSIADLSTTRDTGKIEYDMIWQIFPPGEIVVGKVEGVNALYRVVKYRKSRSQAAWVLTLEYVDWDGERCGLREVEGSYIPEYSGFQRVTSLSIYPLSYADDPEQIKETAKARGRRFQQLRGYQFLHYDGIKIPLGTQGKTPVSWRMLINLPALKIALTPSPLFSPR
ncbi:hypothetical protein VTG60DRAFT_4470 [Thermothelomyces hinnuleus]